MNVKTTTTTATGERVPRFGFNMERYRRHLCLTQTWLAERVGLTQGAISNYASGRTLPNVYRAQAIADALGVDVRTLLRNPLQPAGSSPDNGSSAEVTQMEVRDYKLCKRGHRGHIVGLPPVWLKEQGLKAGDAVRFFSPFDSNDLIIRKATGG